MYSFLPHPQESRNRVVKLFSRRNGRLAGHEVSISAQACLPADRPSRLCIESTVGAIVVESTKGLEYYCSAPR